MNTKNNPSTQISVSIIIINYNYADYLQKAIESCINQSYCTIEIIVVDDGSIDDSKLVIEQFEDDVISIFKENGGMSSALNSGFQVASGEMVIFLDSDDYLFPDAVQRVVTVWDEDVVQVQSRLQVIDQAGKPTGGISPPYSVKFDDEDALSVLLQRGRYSTSVTTGLAFSRKLLEEIFPIPVEQYRMFSEAYIVVSSPFYGEVRSINEPIGTRRIHGSNDWGSADISPKKFRKSIDHDFVRYHTLRKTAQKFGKKVSENLGMRDSLHLTNRISSLRLEPSNHPVDSDSSLALAFYGALAFITMPSQASLIRRISLCIWFICVGTFPRQLAQKYILLLFSPEARPEILRFVNKKMLSKKTTV